MASQPLPPFLDQVNDSLIFNQENKEFIFMVPEVFFDSNSKNAIAAIEGQYVSMMGLCQWYIIDHNGKKSDLKPFRFPTLFLCKPYKIEKIKGVKLEEFNLADREDDIDDNLSDIDTLPDDTSVELAKDYRLLHFRKGDEVVSQIHVPQIIDNVELFYKLAVITAKIPTSIAYDKGWELFLENMSLNGSSYGLSAQLFGVVWSNLCRDPKDISKPFRMTNMKNMNRYKPVSITMLPNYVSPYTSLISVNFDESLRTAVMMSDNPEEEIPHSPLEKIVMQ